MVSSRPTAHEAPPREVRNVRFERRIYSRYATRPKQRARHSKRLCRCVVVVEQQKRRQRTHREQRDTLVVTPWRRQERAYSTLPFRFSTNAKCDFIHLLSRSPPEFSSTAADGRDTFCLDFVKESSSTSSSSSSSWSKARLLRLGRSECPRERERERERDREGQKTTESGGGGVAEGR